MSSAQDESMARGRLVRELEQRQRACPTDLKLAHDLGILSFWFAQSLDDPQEAQEHWRRAMANLAMVLESESYWKGWVDLRASTYGEDIGGESGEAARQAVIRRITQTLIGLDHLLEPGDPFRSYELAYHLEIRSVRLLRQAGGLEMGENGEDRLCCGPLGLARLEFQERLAEKVQELPELDEGVVGLMRMLHRLMEDEKTSPLDLIDQQSRRHLMECFSELGPIRVLLERGEAAKALHALTAGHCPSCDGAASPEGTPGGVELPRVCRETCELFADRNPAYSLQPERGALLLRHATLLMAEALVELAGSSLRSKPPAFDLALEHWQRALQAGAAMDVEEHVKAIVAGSAASWAGAAKRSGRLDDAVTVLEQAGPLVEDDQLSGELARLLTDRGVKAGNDHRWSDATTDLQRALKLNPHLPRTRTNLVTALRGAAFEALTSGEEARASELLEEAAGHLESGLELDEGNEEWKRELTQVRIEIAHAGGESGVPGLSEILGELMDSDQQGPDSPKGKAFQLLAQGAEAMTKGDHETSLQRTREAEQIVPDSPLVLQALATAHNNRGVQLAEEERFDEAVELLEKGLERFPDHEGLSRNLEKIRRARDLHKLLDGDVGEGSMEQLLSLITGMAGEGEEESTPAVASRGDATVDALEADLASAPGDPAKQKEFADGMEKHADDVISQGEREQGLAIARRGLEVFPGHLGLMATVAAAQLASGGGGMPGFGASQPEAEAVAKVDSWVAKTGLKFRRHGEGRYSFLFRTDGGRRPEVQLQILGDLLHLSTPLPAIEDEEPEFLYGLLRASFSPDYFKLCRSAPGRLSLSAEVPVSTADASFLGDLIHDAVALVDMTDEDLGSPETVRQRYEAIRAARTFRKVMSQKGGLSNLLQGEAVSGDSASEIPKLARMAGADCELLGERRFGLTLHPGELKVSTMCTGRAVGFMAFVGGLRPDRGNQAYYRRMTEINVEMDVCKLALDKDDDPVFCYEIPSVDEVSFAEMQQRLPLYVFRYGLELGTLAP